MAKNDLIVRLLLTTKNFDNNLTQSTQQIKKFRRDIETSVGQIAGGFNSAIGVIGKLAPAIGVGMGAVETFRKTILSTQATMDAFRKAVDEAKGAIDFFFQSVARGDFDNFFEGLKTSIKLAGELYVALDNLGTQKIRFSGERSQFETRKQEIMTAMAKARYESDKVEIVNLENALKGLNDEWLASIGKHLEDYSKRTAATLNSQLNRKDVTPEKVLQLTAQANRDKFSDDVKQYADLRRRSKIQNQMIDNTTGMLYNYGPTEDAKAALEILEKIKGTDMEISYYINEQKNDLEETFKSLEEENALKQEGLRLEESRYRIMQKNKRMIGGSSKGTDPLKEDLKKIDSIYATNKTYAGDLRTRDLEKQRAVIEAKLDFATDPGEIDKLFAELIKVKDALQSRMNYSDLGKLEIPIGVGMSKNMSPDKQMSNENVILQNKVANLETPYTHAADMVRQYNNAIEQTTFLYGEQSRQVRELTDEANKLITAYNESNGTAIKLLGDKETTQDIERMSQAASSLGQTLMGISDNPALKALGLSFMIFGSMKAIGEAFAVNAWYGIATAAATAASVVATVSQLKSAKFAGGGIVGDQNIIRANEGEMILNPAQQTRLFNLFNGENARNNSVGKVEFTLRGHDLIGAINNYNKKFSC